MSARYVAVKPIHWGIRPQVAGLLPQALVCVGCIFYGCAIPRAAAADPTATVPDAPAAPHPAVVPPGTFTPSWDLDGGYLWLGPVGAASYLDAKWDSTFGAEAAIVVVRERDALGLLGANLGASRWSARGGGRVWLDALIGTSVLGHMMGASLGPILELSQLESPKIGASIGVWGFAGITPFARIGEVSDLGMFAELGVHIALPVLRR